MCEYTLPVFIYKKSITHIHIINGRVEPITYFLHNVLIHTSDLYMYIIGIRKKTKKQTYAYSTKNSALQDKITSENKSEYDQYVTMT